MTIAARASAGNIFRPGRSGQPGWGQPAAGPGLYRLPGNHPTTNRNPETARRLPDRPGTGPGSDISENQLQKFLKNIDYLRHGKIISQR
ncbi:MAG TPA: hypothetical protein DCR87_04250 [Acidobacteria bacterium]|nr:hypothetical protein [Acidobacteriota bacterium]